jgi:hypothetical protein
MKEPSYREIQNLNRHLREIQREQDAAEVDKCKCGGIYERSRECGAKVCNRCGDHKGLARCYCGWAVSGGNGRQELIEMGETIDAEDY